MGVTYKDLERALAVWTGMDNVVACNSGTAALHLALEALEMPQGSTVVVPDYTMVSCARAVTLAGHVPVFVGWDDRLLMDLDLLDALCSRHVVHAVMAVHVYGRRVAMDQLYAMSRKYRFHVVEDMAEAHGVKPHRHTAAACWSFYRNKVVHGEEGGAVAFKDPTHAAKATMLKSVGFTPQHDFYHIPRGHNYRLADCLADLVFRSLQRFDEEVHERRERELAYNAVVPEECKMPKRDCPWVYDIRIPGLPRSAQAVITHELNAHGIAARVGFKPMTWQAEYNTAKCEAKNKCYDAVHEVMYLPLDSTVTEATVLLAAEYVRAALGAEAL